MKQHEIETARTKLEHAEGIITAHVCSALNRLGPRIGNFNVIVGRTGGRLEIVLDVTEAEAFARYLETKVPTEP